MARAVRHPLDLAAGRAERYRGNLQDPREPLAHARTSGLWTTKRACNIEVGGIDVCPCFSMLCYVT